MSQRNALPQAVDPFILSWHRPLWAHSRWCILPRRGWISCGQRARKTKKKLGRSLKSLEKHGFWRFFAKYLTNIRHFQLYLSSPAAPSDEGGARELVELAEFRVLVEPRIGVRNWKNKENSRKSMKNRLPPTNKLANRRAAPQPDFSAEDRSNGLWHGCKNTFCSFFSSPEAETWRFWCEIRGKFGKIAWKTIETWRNLNCRQLKCLILQTPSRKSSDFSISANFKSSLLLRNSAEMSEIQRNFSISERKQ